MHHSPYCLLLTGSGSGSIVLVLVGATERSGSLASHIFSSPNPPYCFITGGVYLLVDEYWRHPNRTNVAKMDTRMTDPLFRTALISLVDPYTANLASSLVTDSYLESACMIVNKLRSACTFFCKTKV